MANDQKLTIKRIRSTADMVRDFMSSILWEDMKEELNGWLLDIETIQDESDDHVDLYRCQGRKEAVRNLVNFPEILLDAIEESTNVKRTEDNN